MQHCPYIYRARTYSYIACAQTNLFVVFFFSFLFAWYYIVVFYLEHYFRFVWCITLSILLPLNYPRRTYLFCAKVNNWRALNVGVHTHKHTLIPLQIHRIISKQWPNNQFYPKSQTKQQIMHFAISQWWQWKNGDLFQRYVCQQYLLFVWNPKLYQNIVKKTYIT